MHCFSDRVRSSSLGKMQKPKKSQARSILSAKTEGDQLKAAIRSACFDDSCISGRRYSSANAPRKPEGKPARAISCLVPRTADPCASTGSPAAFGQRARSRRAEAMANRTEELSQTARLQAAPMAPLVQVEGGPEIPQISLRRS